MHRETRPAPPCALPDLPRRVILTDPPRLDYFALACLMAYGRTPGVRIADEEEEA